MKTIFIRLIKNSKEKTHHLTKKRKLYHTCVWLTWVIGGERIKFVFVDSGQSTRTELSSQTKEVTDITGGSERKVGVSANSCCEPLLSATQEVQ